MYRNENKLSNSLIAFSMITGGLGTMNLISYAAHLGDTHLGHLKDSSGVETGFLFYTMTCVGLAFAYAKRKTGSGGPDNINGKWSNYDR